MFYYRCVLSSGSFSFIFAICTTSCITPYAWPFRNTCFAYFDVLISHKVSLIRTFCITFPKLTTCLYNTYNCILCIIGCIHLSLFYIILSFEGFEVMSNDVAYWLTDWLTALLDIQEKHQVYNRNEIGKILKGRNTTNFKAFIDLVIEGFNRSQRTI